MYKVIFLDIDGTIKNDEGVITERTKNAIKEITEMGIKVILCSARDREKSAKISEECGASQYVIAYNGAEIYDYSQNISLYKAIINKESLQKLSDLISHYGLELIITRDNSREKVTDIQSIISGDVLQARIKLKETSQRDKLTEKLRRISGISIYELYRDEYKRIVDIQYATRIDYFLVKKNTNKWEAIKMFCQTKNININNIISIGDGENDVEMIQNSGLGIAPKNAPEYIKRMANVVIPSNNNDGVAIFLEELKEKIYDEERGER